jgi:hypothetical protein
MVCEERKAIQNEGRVTRALNVIAHTTETCETHSHESTPNTIGLSRREQIDVEYQRYKAQFIANHQMIR